MLYCYEKACREAGMEEEKIRELRRGFDADYKRLKRENAEKDKIGYSVILLSALEEEYASGSECLIADPDIDVERDAINNYELGRLREILTQMPEEERDFLLASFEDARGTEKQVAEKKGMTRRQVYLKREKLVAQLRKQMGYKNR